MDNIIEFKKELKILLKKYNASIDFSVSDCSDTYGLHDENIGANIDGVAVKLIDGWSIEQSDL